MSVICGHFRACHPIPQLDATVPTSGHHRLAIGREGNGRDIPGVSQQGVDQLPSPGVLRGRTASAENRKEKQHVDGESAKVFQVIGQVDRRHPTFT